MIISFDRNCRKKAIGTVSVPSRDVNQILDDIEEEMSRLYSEVCDHYAKQKKDFRKSLFRKRKASREEEICNEVDEMELISKTISQIGRRLTEKN